MIRFSAPGQKDWYLKPLDGRARKGGEWGLNAKDYRGGEFLPKYIPRPIMPQIDAKDLHALLHFLRAHKIGVKFAKVPASRFHHEQRTDALKVAAIAGQPQLLKKPILASRDGGVLDGNHRLDAHVATGTPVPAFIIDLPFEQAIAALFAFPKTYAFGDGAKHPIAN